jgi:predicted naringenin-chalcone synthase
MHQNKDATAILSLGTAVPKYQASQQALGRWMANSFKDHPALGRWLRRVYANSGIETRHACLPDFLDQPHLSRLAPGRDGADTLTTAERMTIYERESVKLGEAAGQQALLDYATSSGSQLSSVVNSITHLIVVSCTGFFAPGLDMALAHRLNLPATVQRTLIGFMGCAAGFNGLQTASHIVKGQPSARVLIISVELCSLHIQPGTERENLLSACLFADGAAACVVGQPSERDGNFFVVNNFHTRLKPDTADQMVWQIGNHGFALRLSPKIPVHLAEAAPSAFKYLWKIDAQPRFWAIHPGGKAIVDGLATFFQLQSKQVQASRSVLRRFGNMSSATIFFVLDELRLTLSRQTHNGHQASNDHRLEGVAIGFGPGLVIEMAHLTYIPPATLLSHRLELPQRETSAHGELA